MAIRNAEWTPFQKAEFPPEHRHIARGDAVPETPDPNEAEE